MRTRASNFKGYYNIYTNFLEILDLLENFLLMYCNKNFIFKLYNCNVQNNSDDQLPV